MSILASFDRYLPQVFSRDAVDFWLQRFSKTASINGIWAQVVAKEERVPGVVTIQLRPNRNWKGFQAGQHAELRFEVDGRRLTRRWTISNAETSPVLEFNISKIANGRVTPWIHERIEVGDTVELSAAQGDFVLPATNEDVLFIAGGVGITPALAMIRTLARTNFRRAFTLMHYVRSEELAIARAELETLSVREPNFRYELFVTNDGVPGVEQRRISSEHVRRAQPRVEASHVFLCGPAPFMDAAKAAVESIAPGIDIRQEYFVAPSRQSDGTGGTIRFTSSRTEIEANASQTLLEAAEAAGLTPRFGCRAGICMQCACTKKSGVVIDIRNGRVLDEENQRIQICITQPAGPVELDI